MHTTRCGKGQGPILIQIFLAFECVGDGSHSWIAAGAEPDAHQFVSQLVYERSDLMEVNSKQHYSNSETRPDMHGQVRS
jgi:hypothetical protein